MRPRLLLAVLLPTLFGFSTWGLSTCCARETIAAPVTAPKLELVVFVAERCTYCDIFKRDVAPSYAVAPLSATAPLRFVDIGKVDIDRMRLAARLEILPTAVLLKDGQEVQRISGLTSPSTFYVLLKHMIAQNGD